MQIPFGRCLLKFRVLFDTNVLIAASLNVMSEELQIKLKHPFFDQSMNLIGIIKKHIHKRIGVVTTTIEDEANSILEQAVMQELRKKITDREVDFELFSVILNSSEARLKLILSYLLREPIDPFEVEKNIVKVEEMYSNLLEKARTLPKPASLLTEAVPKGFKKLAFDIYKTQDEILNSQLTNLLRKPPETTDKKILAEAIYLCKLYRETEGKELQFYIASTDYHFSPVRKKGLESRQVTDAIYELFGIICDWPLQIAKILQEHLK